MIIVIYITAYAVNQRNVPVTMEAKLDASYDRSYVDQTTDENHRLFEWVRLSEIKADRKLQCTVTSLQPGEPNCSAFYPRFITYPMLV